MRTTIALAFDILMSEVTTSDSVVKAKDKELSEAKSELYKKIQGFNQRRLEVFEVQLRINKVLWCTRCNQMFPEDQFELVLTVERGTVSCGYEGGDYAFKTERKLHRVCTTCKTTVYQKNGWYGPWDRGANDQASYHAYQIEFREGEYYQDSRKLEERLPGMPPALFVRLSQEWEIPPELGVDRNGNVAVKGVGEIVFVP